MGVADDVRGRRHRQCDDRRAAVTVHRHPSESWDLKP
jgi:hypothetical protein